MGTEATQNPATNTAGIPTSVTLPEAKPENQTMPVSAASIQKKKYTKKSVCLVKDDNEPE